MAKVYAVGRVKDKRKLYGYKILNLEDYSLHDYSVDRLKELLSKRNIIGNLYIEKDGSLAEYHCSGMLPEYNMKGKRIGAGRDVYLTLSFAPSAIGSDSSGRLVKNEVYFSKDELVETIDLIELQYKDPDAYLELPFMNNYPVDRYIESYARAYEALNNSTTNVNHIRYKIDNFGKLTCKVPAEVDKLVLGYCKGFEGLYFDGTTATINNLIVSGTCEALLPNAIQECYLKNVKVSSSILCQQVFKNCRIDSIDLSDINVESKLLLFDNCKIQHLVLPKWYDSWEFLDAIEYPIEEVELRNTNCTTAIWEISTKNKLQFKKVMKLILPSDFEEQQEDELRRLLPTMKIVRKLPDVVE